MPKARYPPLFSEKTVYDRRPYLGRPSASHVVAQLVAHGRIKKSHRILDLGCGRGPDVLALATWGYRKLHALDINKFEIDVAKGREADLLAKPVVDWVVGTMRALDCFDDRYFDVVIDTFLLSNFDEKDHEAYFAEVHRLLRRRGLLVLHYKVNPGWEHGGGMPRPGRKDWRVVDKFETAFVEGEGGMEKPELAVVYLLERK